MHRVPFFLEPSYLSKDAAWTEPHTSRMVRKFGSLARFDEVKRRHGLIPRGAEVGLDASCGYTQAQLSLRVQSSTLNSHRLILYVAERWGWAVGEALYAIFNRKHFLEAGVLNDRELLAASLGEVGLEGAALHDSLTFLDSERGTDTVLAHWERVQALGIFSIPTLVVDGKYRTSGAGRADEVLALLERAVRASPNGSSGLFGDLEIALEPDGGRELRLAAP